MRWASCRVFDGKPTVAHLREQGNTTPDAQGHDELSLHKHASPVIRGRLIVIADERGESLGRDCLRLRSGSEIRRESGRLPPPSHNGAASPAAPAKALWRAIAISSEEQILDLGIGRKATGLAAGVFERAVDGDVELAGSTGAQLEVGRAHSSRGVPSHGGLAACSLKRRNIRSGLSCPQGGSLRIAASKGSLR